MSTVRSLETLLVSAISAGMTARGFPNLPVISQYQTQQQGRPETAITFHRLFDVYYGSPGIFRRDEVTDGIVEDEITIVESTYQLSAITKESPEVSAISAVDIVNTLARVMRSQLFMDLLMAGDAQILRVTDSRNNWAKNDRDQYEPNPSFDAIITHKEVYTSTTPIATVNHKIIGI